MLKKFLRNYLITLAIFIPLLAFFVLEFGYVVEQRQMDELSRDARLISMILEPHLLEGDRAALAAAVREVERRTAEGVALYLPDGTVVAGSKGQKRQAARPPDMAELHHRGRLTERTGSGMGATAYASITIPIEDDTGKMVGALRVTAPLAASPFSDEISLFGAALVVALTLAAAVLAFTLLTQRRFNDSFDRLLAASQQIAEGVFDAEVPFKGSSGEIGRFSRSLDLIARRLKKLFAEVEAEKELRGAVLGAMSEGVIMVSRSGSTLLVNEAFKRIFSLTDEGKGKPYLEVIRNREIAEIIEEVIREDRPVERDVTLFYPVEKSYKAYALPLHAPEPGVMLVLYDVTEFRRLEEIKSDFVANVSHELRTPLTALKGYVETMLDAPDLDETRRRRFLEVMERNIDRLIRIVNDLLVLSEAERKGTPWHRWEEQTERVDLGEVVSEAVGALRSSMEAKRIELTLDMPQGGGPSLEGDRFLLVEMVINLLENAVKYTPEGGEVKITVRQRDGACELGVEDTGIGIPREHLPRIFERFYRVDKTRSRAEGGTGLGLSIVKHIALLHGGDVRVESRLGEGSAFWVTLRGRGKAKTPPAPTAHPS